MFLDCFFCKLIFSFFQKKKELQFFIDYFFSSWFLSHFRFDSLQFYACRITSGAELCFASVLTNIGLCGQKGNSLWER